MAKTKLYLVNVQKKCEWGRKSSKEIEKLLRMSKGLDVELLTFFSDSPLTILRDCIATTNVEYIVFASHDQQSLEIAELLGAIDEKLKISIW